MTDQSEQYRALIMSVFPNAVVKMADEINPWYYCQDCKYFEQEGYWYPNSDDTDDLFMCTWCWSNQWEELYEEEWTEDDIDSDWSVWR